MDNASPAEDLRTNLDIFENKALDFDVKHLAQNIGFPGAANEGARMGHSDLIMFLSDDVKLMDGTMDKIVSDFKDETVGIVGIKLLFPL
ncbi:glycosyltransferase, partial [Staphylococcus aureus]|nr:glycosyltransferase [Staphylococcus aureus]